MGAGPRLQCNTCLAVIQSTHRHAYIRCECPRDSKTWCAIDGGDAYTKLCWASDATSFTFIDSPQDIDDPEECDVDDERDSSTGEQ